MHTNEVVIQQETKFTFIQALKLDKIDITDPF